MNCPKFSIIIVNHKTLKLTKTCLESIRSCSVGSSYEVIVVDNNSNDESLHYLRDQQDIRLIERTSGLHYGPADHGDALDIGLMYARGDYVVSVDSDVVLLQQSWLETLAGILEKERAVLIGPSFYRNFVHPCILMIKRQIPERSFLSFAPRSYFHRYYDTAEFITSVLKKHHHRIVVLDSWTGDHNGSSPAKPIDGTQTDRWVREWWPLAAKHGVFVGGVAFHSFYGTRVLNSDCDGFLGAIHGREVRLPEVGTYRPTITNSYVVMTDKQNRWLKFKQGIGFIVAAANWTVRRLLVRMRDRLFQSDKHFERDSQLSKEQER